jgi:serine/threonine-protein kinase HipA
MRQVTVYRNGVEAGILTEENRQSYVFRYSDAYLANKSLPAISLTIPKTVQSYRSEYLFPFFFNMLSEGVNRKLQSLQLKIDESDSFGLLMATAQYDTIGAVTVKPMER